MESEKPTTEHIEHAAVQNAQPPVALITDTNIKSSHDNIYPVSISIRQSSQSDAKSSITGAAADTDAKKQSTPQIASPSVPQKTFLSPPKLSRYKSAEIHLARKVNSFKDRWIFEAICCIWALCSLFAIITTLAIHQERSVPNWPYKISINTLISIFTALMKAAMMLVVAAAISQLKWHWFCQPHVLADMERFDEATRGPWGAFTLILTVRKHYLASFGALITVVAMAIDPFSQQIIQYYTCTESLPGSVASLPRANNYTVGGFLSKPGFAELDSTMAAAMYMGTIDPPVNPSSNIAFDCSTGNCTFPAVQNATFSTLGMCYSVMDLSTYIKPNITNNVTVGYWLPDLSWGMPADNMSYAEADVGMDNLGTSGPAQALSTIAKSHWKMLAPKKGLDNGPGFTADFESLFTFDTLMLKVNSSCPVMDGDIHLSENCDKYPWAFRASLYPCVKTYKSTIFKSVPQETPVSTTPLRKTNASAIEVTTTANLTWSLATDHILVNGSWQECQVSNHFTPSTPVPISINRTLQLDLTAPTTWYPSECVWMLDYVPALALNQFLSWMYDESPLLAVTSNTVITAGSIWLKPLYRNGTADIDSVTSYMDGLASAMTAVIRQRGSGRVLGTVQTSQTCIHVNWAWMSLPAVLVGLTGLLLVLTMMSCRKTGLWEETRSWRGSSLALLFHGCEEGVRGRVERVVGIGEMKEVAEEVVVELKRTGEGLRFVERREV